MKDVYIVLKSVNVYPISAINWKQRTKTCAISVFLFTLIFEFVKLNVFVIFNLFITANIVIIVLKKFNGSHISSEIRFNLK